MDAVMGEFRVNGHGAVVYLCSKKYNVPHCDPSVVRRGQAKSLRR